MESDSVRRGSAGAKNVGWIGAAALAVSFVAAGLMMFAAVPVGASASVGVGQESIVGAWEAQSYMLSTGEDHALAGKIFFTSTDWQVVFFVLDTDANPRRGSAEGGTYATEGDSLTFMHRFNLSIGEALPGLPADDLRMVVHDTMTAEAAHFAVDHDTLTLFFPSGNEMRFRRTS